MKLSIGYVDGSIDHFNGSDAKKVYEKFVFTNSRGHRWLRVELVASKESFNEDKELWIQMSNIISVVKE